LDPFAPAEAACASRGLADIDGDGGADTVVLWGVRNSNNDHWFDPTWHLEIELSSGSRVPSLILLPRAPTYPVLIVAEGDIGGDGREEVFIQFDHGASTRSWLMLAWGHGALRLVTLDGTTMGFGVSGSVTHGSGFECRTADDKTHLITTLAIGLPDRSYFYPWTETDYQLVGTEVRFVAERTGTAPLAEVNDPSGRFRRFWGAHCPPRLSFD